MEGGTEPLDAFDLDIDDEVLPDDPVQAGHLQLASHRAPLYLGVNVVGRASTQEDEEQKVADWRKEFGVPRVHGIFVQAGSISAKHAAIFVEQRGTCCFVKDLGSLNRTALRRDGRSLPLTVGDRYAIATGSGLRFGDVEATLYLAEVPVLRVPPTQVVGPPAPPSAPGAYPMAAADLDQPHQRCERVDDHQQQAQRENGDLLGMEDVDDDDVVWQPVLSGQPPQQEQQQRASQQHLSLQQRQQQPALPLVGDRHVLAGASACEPSRPLVSSPPRTCPLDVPPADAAGTAVAPGDDGVLLACCPPYPAGVLPADANAVQQHAGAGIAAACADDDGLLGVDDDDAVWQPVLSGQPPQEAPQQQLSPPHLPQQQQRPQACPPAGGQTPAAASDCEVVCSPASSLQLPHPAGTSSAADPGHHAAADAAAAAASRLGNSAGGTSCSAGDGDVIEDSDATQASDSGGAPLLPLAAAGASRAATALVPPPPPLDGAEASSRPPGGGEGAGGRGGINEGRAGDGTHPPRAGDGAHPPCAQPSAQHGEQQQQWGFEEAAGAGPPPNGLAAGVAAAGTIVSDSEEAAEGGEGDGVQPSGQEGGEAASRPGGGGMLPLQSPGFAARGVLGGGPEEGDSIPADASIPDGGADSGFAARRSGCLSPIGLGTQVAMDALDLLVDMGSGPGQLPGQVAMMLAEQRQQQQAAASAAAQRRPGKPPSRAKPAAGTKRGRSRSRSATPGEQQRDEDAFPEEEEEEEEDTPQRTRPAKRARGGRGMSSGRGSAAAAAKRTKKGRGGAAGRGKQRGGRGGRKGASAVAGDPHQHLPSPPAGAAVPRGRRWPGARTRAAGGGLLESGGYLESALALAKEAGPGDDAGRGVEARDGPAGGLAEGAGQAAVGHHGKDGTVLAEPGEQVAAGEATSAGGAAVEEQPMQVDIPSGSHESLQQQQRQQRPLPSMLEPLQQQQHESLQQQQQQQPLPSLLEPQQQQQPSQLAADEHTVDGNDHTPASSEHSPSLARRGNGPAAMTSGAAVVVLAAADGGGSTMNWRGCPSPAMPPPACPSSQHHQWQQEEEEEDRCEPVGRERQGRRLSPMGARTATPASTATAAASAGNVGVVVLFSTSLPDAQRRTLARRVRSLGGSTLDCSGGVPPSPAPARASAPRVGATLPAAPASGSGAAAAPASGSASADAVVERGGGGDAACFTHFVVPAPRKGAARGAGFKASFHALLALAAGRAIVDQSWVEACRQSGRFVEPERHLLRDVQAERRLGFDMAESYRRARQRRLLTERGVLLTPELLAAEADGGSALRQLVTAAGGTLLPPPLGGGSTSPSAAAGCGAGGGALPPTAAGCGADGGASTPSAAAAHPAADDGDAQQQQQQGAARAGVMSEAAEAQDGVRQPPPQPAGPAAPPPHPPLVLGCGSDAERARLAVNLAPSSACAVLPPGTPVYCRAMLTLSLIRQQLPIEPGKGEAGGKEQQQRRSEHELYRI